MHDDLHEQFAALPRSERIEILIRCGALDVMARRRLLAGPEREAFDRAVTTQQGRDVVVQAIDGYCAPELNPGDVYEYDASNPHLITPCPDWRPVVVVWCDGEDVHYRKEDSSKVHTTSMARFLDTTRPATVKVAA